jgi:GNAT superfamily N-acetyltransferase
VPPHSLGLLWYKKGNEQEASRLAPLTKQQKGRRVRPHSTVLRAPRSTEEWRRYHDTRKRCIFDKYNGKGSEYYFEYNPAHPDERDPANHPMVFLLDGQVIGTIRIDIKPDGRAIFRLVAIDVPWQGQGLGSIMLELAEDHARACGAHTVCLNSVPEAYHFYTRHGFSPSRWDGCTHNRTEIPVLKMLRPEPAAPGSMVATRRPRPFSRCARATALSTEGGWNMSEARLATRSRPALYWRAPRRHLARDAVRPRCDVVQAGGDVGDTGTYSKAAARRRIEA